MAGTLHQIVAAFQPARASDASYGLLHDGGCDGSHPISPFTQLL